MQLLSQFRSRLSLGTTTKSGMILMAPNTMLLCLISHGPTLSISPVSLKSIVVRPIWRTKQILLIIHPQQQAALQLNKQVTEVHQIHQPRRYRKLQQAQMQQLIQKHHQIIVKQWPPAKIKHKQILRQNSLKLILMKSLSKMPHKFQIKSKTLQVDKYV